MSPTEMTTKRQRDIGRVVFIACAVPLLLAFLIYEAWFMFLIYARFIHPYVPTWPTLSPLAFVGLNLLWALFHGFDREYEGHKSKIGTNLIHSIVLPPVLYALGDLVTAVVHFFN